MAGMAVELHVDGLSKAERSLHRLSRNVEDMVPAFLEIQEGLEEYHKRTWGRGIQTDPDTRVRWPGTSTLDNTGDLKDSMTRRDAEGAIREVSPRTFSYGTSRFYGRFLQDGTVRQAPKPFLKLNTTTLILTRKVVQEHIVKGTDFELGFL